MFRLNKKAFTLVELLVIIAIVGIISSAAVVNLRGAKEKAFRASILATVHHTSRAILPCLYTNEHLSCDGARCNGENDIIAGSNICPGGDIWPVFDNPEIDWYKATYDIDNLEFCIEAYHDDPNLAGNWTDPYEFFSCTQDGCSYDWHSDCAQGCSGENEACGTGCCGGLFCHVGTCRQFIPVST